MNFFTFSTILISLFLSPSLCFAQCNCGNGVLDVADGETGIDCGGPCLPCNNMVTNGSFEAHSSPFDCFFSTLGNIDLAPPWTWADATERPDHMHSCHSDVNVQTPNNYLGSQAPNSGCGYAAILVH